MFSFTVKKMKLVKYLILVISVLLFLNSCRKIEHLPDIPRIEFTSFQIFDTTDILGNMAKGGRLKFYFEDGDGDLGLNAPGSYSAYTTNLFFTLYRKTGGSIVQAPDNDPLRPSSYRIPFMERKGVNTILKGTISVTFLYLFYNQTDTIQYEFFLKDRALNESNVESTSEIIVSKNELYKKPLL
jgi:hypothetical protein